MTTELNNETLKEAPVDAATVILLRDSTDDIEVLLLCRGKSKTVMNKAWVFPGGKLDPEDFASQNTVNELSLPASEMLNEPALDADRACALFNAACRETFEETGVKLRVTDLVPWSRWITPNEPAVMKKRFDARFFVAAMPEGQIALHDGSEATDSAWHTPRGAITNYINHQLTLAPPQIMTLVALCEFRDVESCVKFARTADTYCIEPGVLKAANGRTLVYPGDTEHRNPHKQMPGPTRLLWKNGHFEPEMGFERWFSQFTGG